MRIIIAPAKKMAVDTDSVAPESTPVFLERTREVAAWLQGMSPAKLKELWKCSDKILAENLERLARLDLERNLTPAILAYEGIQYQYMAPAVFEDGEFAWMGEHVRILSGFYGALRPLDGVVPYRLEMQAKGAPGEARNLYEYWGSSLYEEVMRGNSSRAIVNLASKEYSKAIEKYLEPGDTFITCIFGELAEPRPSEAGGAAGRAKPRVVQKGVYAKMARGEMVRYLASIHAEEPEAAQGFRWSGYEFSPELSDDATYVFLRSERGEGLTGARGL